MPKGQVAWNKGLTKETDNRIISHTSWNKGLTKETDERVNKISLSTLGRKTYIRDDVYKYKMSIKHIDDNNPYWKGGCESYWHKKARKLFGKDNCDKCDINMNEHKYKYNQILHMHCMSDPKNYKLMEESNWMTLCIVCHNKVESNKDC